VGPRAGASIGHATAVKVAWCADPEKTGGRGRLCGLPIGVENKRDGWLRLVNFAEVGGVEGGAAPEARPPSRCAGPRKKTGAQVAPASISDRRDGKQMRASGCGLLNPVEPGSAERGLVGFGDILQA
jgi:hypothetical protein